MKVGSNTLPRKNKIGMYKIKIPNGVSAAKVILELIMEDAQSTKISCHSSIKYQQLGMEFFTFFRFSTHTNHIVSVTVSQVLICFWAMPSMNVQRVWSSKQFQLYVITHVCNYGHGMSWVWPFVKFQTKKLFNASWFKPGPRHRRSCASKRSSFAVAIHPSWPWWSALSASKRLVTLPFWMKWPRSPDSVISLPGRVGCESCERQVYQRCVFLLQKGI